MRGEKQEMILWYGNFNDRGDLIWEEAVNEMYQNPEAGEMLRYP